MEKVTFLKRTVKVAELIVHPYVGEAGLDNTPDTVIQKMLSDTGLYERLIITENHEVLTHVEEFRAAVENGVMELEVYVVCLTPLQLKVLTLLKHKYGQKNLLASYQIAAFFRKIITDGEEVEWLGCVDGDFNAKIAALLGTSDSTIKRLLRVGDQAYDKLGLIQHGEMSFKEVIDNLKLEKMAQKVNSKNVDEAHVAPSLTKRNEPIETKSDEAKIPVEAGVQLINDAKAANALPENLHPEKVGKTNQTSTGMVSFSSATMTFAGLGDLAFNMTSGTPNVTVNGNVVKNMEYIEYLGTSNENGDRTDSFVIRQKRHDGFSLQITIENPSKAA